MQITKQYFVKKVETNPICKKALQFMGWDGMGWVSIHSIQIQSQPPLLSSPLCMSMTCRKILESSLSFLFSKNLIFSPQMGRFLCIC